MFKKGNFYWISMNDGRGTVSAMWKVIEVDLPLIKVSGVDSEQILNTGSLGFIKAELREEGAAEPGIDEWLSSLKTG